MEAGSLLEQALQHSKESLFDQEGTKNTLIIDVFMLDNPINSISALQALAKLASTCNSFLSSQKYHWHFGGDGPIFGIYEGDEGVLCLRAYCRYGPSVADEWIAIEYVFQMSKEIKEDIAISCWDAEDGQILLVQAAEVLPEWLDMDATDLHRYACWIRNGRIQLLSERHISLHGALTHLREQPKETYVSYERIQRRIEECLKLNHEVALATQRVPLVVPRSVAALIRSRPDLVHIAIQTFCEHTSEPLQDMSKYSDWVWTTTSISRTNYAMMRTVVSNVWESADFVPPAGVEVKRYTRLCKMDATPHLKHAVQLGVRLVVGLEFLAKMKHEVVSTSKRVSYWTQISDNIDVGGTWILESFHQGPNLAKHDISHILQCPVFPEEAENLTLRSYPDVPMKQQLLNGQKTLNENEEFPMPLQDDVDGEEWLTLDESGNLEGATDLDAILSRFQSFMIQPSDIEGIAPAKSVTSKRVRPRIFLNILRSALNGDSLIFPVEEDDFFYKEDYDMMHPDSEAPDNESSDIQGFMEAMDNELHQKTKSRTFDTVENIGGGDDNTEVAENSHVLNNLLQSLEASAGNAGPVSNILNGM